MRSTRSLIALVVVSAMSLVLAPAAHAIEVDLHARLHGSVSFPRATGSSEYERDSQGRELEVTVRNIGALAGQSVVVQVAGVRVGTMLVRNTGVAHREWDTERGQSVPFVSVGDYVRVRTTSGTLVASGRFFRSAVD